MIELLPAPKPDIVAFRIKGDVDRTSFEVVTEEIERKLANNDDLRIYTEVEDLGDIPPDVLLDDLRFSLKNASAFRKAAIVSDKRWLEIMAKAQDKLWPGASVRHFGFGEQDTAMGWLAAA